MLEGEMQQMESGWRVSGPEHRHEETVDFQTLSFDRQIIKISLEDNIYDFSSETLLVHLANSIT